MQILSALSRTASAAATQALRLAAPPGFAALLAGIGDTATGGRQAPATPGNGLPVGGEAVAGAPAPDPAAPVSAAATGLMPPPVQALAGHVVPVEAPAPAVVRPSFADTGAMPTVSTPRGSVVNFTAPLQTPVPTDAEAVTTTPEPQVAEAAIAAMRPQPGRTDSALAPRAPSTAAGVPLDLAGVSAHEAEPLHSGLPVQTAAPSPDAMTTRQPPIARDPADEPPVSPTGPAPMPAPVGSGLPQTRATPLPSIAPTTDATVAATGLPLPDVMPPRVRTVTYAVPLSQPDPAGEPGTVAAPAPIVAPRTANASVPQPDPAAVQTPATEPRIAHAAPAAPFPTASQTDTPVVPADGPVVAKPVIAPGQRPDDAATAPEAVMPGETVAAPSKSEDVVVRKPSRKPLAVPEPVVAAPPVTEPVRTRDDPVIPVERDRDPLPAPDVVSAPLAPPLPTAGLTADIAPPVRAAAGPVVGADVSATALPPVVATGADVPVATDGPASPGDRSDAAIVAPIEQSTTIETAAGSALPPLPATPADRTPADPSDVQAIRPKTDAPVARSRGDRAVPPAPTRIADVAAARPVLPTPDVAIPSDAPVAVAGSPVPAATPVPTGTTPAMPAAPPVVAAPVAPSRQPIAGESAAPVIAIAAPLPKASAAPVTRIAGAAPPAAPRPELAMPAEAVAIDAADPAPRRRDDDAPALQIATPIPDTAIARPVVAPAQVAQGTLDMRSDAWMQGMIERIETLRDTATGTAETRIRLSPDALGDVEIAIRTASDGSVQVRFASENADAGRLLADAQPRLLQLAEARGMKLGGMQVDVGTQQQQQQQRPSHESPAAPPRAPRATAGATMVTDPVHSDNRIA